MIRFLVLSLAVLLVAQAAPALAQTTSITVKGKLTDGNYVSAEVAVGKNGQVSGSGALIGTNFSRAFTITKASTTTGKLVLTGTITGANIPVTITATVPNGALSFSYLVNGNTYTLTGIGIVTAK